MLRRSGQPPASAPGHPRRRPCRCGFTVIEVLVALIVIATGLLGVAAASAMSLRASSAALRERAATMRARTRFAMLDAAGCSRVTDGELLLGAGLVERWTAGSAVHGVRLVEVRVDWDDVGRRRTLVLRSALLC